MVIPCELVLLLERLLAKRVEIKKGFYELVEPPFEDRVEIYWQAFEMAKQDFALTSYVLGHSRLVWQPKVKVEQLFLMAAE